MISHLSTDWQSFFIDHKYNAETNKKINGLEKNLDGFTPEECVKILLEEDNTIFMIIHPPITKQIELSHHFNQFSIWGDEASPNILYSNLVLGFDLEEAQYVVMIDPAILFGSKQF
jgi:hypothetical protein